MRFEDAMEYRDLIRSIQKIGERQKITGYGEEDKDIIAVAMDESLDLREQDAVVQVFFVRGGKLIPKEPGGLLTMKACIRNFARQV